MQSFPFLLISFFCILNLSPLVSSFWLLIIHSLPSILPNNSLPMWSDLSKPSACFAVHSSSMSVAIVSISPLSFSSNSLQFVFLPQNTSENSTFKHFKQPIKCQIRWPFLRLLSPQCLHNWHWEHLPTGSDHLSSGISNSPWNLWLSQTVRNVYIFHYSCNFCQKRF